MQTSNPFGCSLTAVSGLYGYNTDNALAELKRIEDKHSDYVTCLIITLSADQVPLQKIVEADGWVRVFTYRSNYVHHFHPVNIYVKQLEPRPDPYTVKLGKIVEAENVV